MHPFLCKELCRLLGIIFFVLFTLKKFLKLQNIIITYASEDDTMFALDDDEPACAIITLCGFFIIV